MEEPGSQIVKRVFDELDKGSEALPRPTKFARVADDSFKDEPAEQTDKRLGDANLKAAKADDAEVPKHIWNDRIDRLLKNRVERKLLDQALETLRKFGHKWWHGSPLDQKFLEMATRSVGARFGQAVTGRGAGRNSTRHVFYMVGMGSRLKDSFLALA
jgi:hypothetical protein